MSTKVSNKTTTQPTNNREGGKKDEKRTTNGNSNNNDGSQQQHDNALRKIKEAIPSHCFQKSYFWSTFYLVREFAILSVLYYFRNTFWEFGGWLGYFVWANLVGFFGWCLFVVGHDCGHGSFSDSPLWNQICGHVAHTPLMVPFHGWQISHFHHHMNHNHLTKDHGWKPATEEEVKAMSPFFRTFRSSVFVMGLYYWYLLCVPESIYLSGCHYNPYSRLFKPHQRTEATISSLSVFFWILFLFKTFNFSDLIYFYFVPALIFSTWLSIVTYLHHTHPDASIYGDDTWNYFKGSLMTVDRSYGKIVNYFHHNIETHVVHHMFFTSIPHYRLVEATEAVKPLLGKEYFFDPTPIFSALLRALSECSFIRPSSDEKGVYHFNGYDEKKKVRGKFFPDVSGTTQKASGRKEDM